MSDSRLFPRMTFLRGTAQFTLEMRPYTPRLTVCDPLGAPENAVLRRPADDHLIQNQVVSNRLLNAPPHIRTNAVPGDGRVP